MHGGALARCRGLAGGYLYASCAHDDLVPVLDDDLLLAKPLTHGSSARPLAHPLEDIEHMGAQRGR